MAVIRPNEGVKSGEFLEFIANGCYDKPGVMEVPCRFLSVGHSVQLFRIAAIKSFKEPMMHRSFCCFVAILSAVALVAPVHADDIFGNNIPNIDYDPDDGLLSVNTDGADMISLLINGPQAMSIDRWGDGSNGDGVMGWVQQYFNGKEQWVGAGSAVAGGSVDQGIYQIATYAAGLDAAAFGDVELGTQSFGTLFTGVNVIGVPDIACDFDGDGVCDITDIDMITIDMVAGTNDLNLDIDGSGTVDGGDIDEWRSVAATQNGWAEPYFRGDANLDGTINSADLNKVGLSWQQAQDRYSEGDFNGDGTVAAADLNAVGLNWQKSIAAASSAAAVPEPGSALLLVFGLFALAVRRR